MKIGIASPISVKFLQKYLSNVEEKYLELGLGGTSVNNIILGLLGLGHEVSVYTLDWNVKKNEPVILKGEKLTIYIGHFRHFNKFNKLKLIDFMYYEGNQIKNFILDDNPDIVNAHWSYEYSLGVIMSNYHHLITFRDDSITILKLTRKFYRLIRLLIDFWVRSHGSNFSVNSPYLQKRINIKKKDIPVIPNPFNPNIEIGTHKTINSKNIKIVSILNGWGDLKNPQNSILAFNKLQKEMIDYELEYHLYGLGYEIGSPGYKWCKNRNLLDNVHFYGKVDYSELMKKLSDYDILLHPAREESFGNTLIEALIKGVPVVAGKDSGAVSWVLNYGKNGILVDVNEPADICKKLKELIIDKKTYNKLSKTGIKFALNNYSSVNVAKRYLKEYKKVLGL